LNFNVKLEKQRVGEEVWLRLEKSGVARFPLPVWGRIPNFEGAEVAAEKLRQREVWRKLQQFSLILIRHRSLLESALS
jgi:5-formyltetrahydrofolate cyclo-ligase